MSSNLTAFLQCIVADRIIENVNVFTSCVSISAAVCAIVLLVSHFFEAGV